MHQANKQTERSRAETSQRDKRRKLIMFVTVCLCIAALVVTAAFVYLRTSKTDPRERIVYRNLPGGGGGSLDIKISWNKEPADQAKRRRLLRRKRRKAGGRKTASAQQGQDITYLGDASKEGGDELLSQKQIQTVMQGNIRRLARCISEQARRDPSLRRVAIDFGVQGTGLVSYVKVNGESSGLFQACIAKRMNRIKFPTYDGTLTRASFTMNLGS